MRCSTTHLADERSVQAPRPSSRLGLGLLVIAMMACGASPAPTPARAGAWPCRADALLEALCRGGGDSDGDGWPDDLEVFLGTNAAAADTDGDGIDDPADRCPLLAADETTAFTSALRSAAALLAAEAPAIIAVAPGQPRVCFVELRGIQLHGRAGPWEYATLAFMDTEHIPEHPEEGDEATFTIRVGGALSGCAMQVVVRYEARAWRAVRAEPSLCA